LEYRSEKNHWKPLEVMGGYPVSVDKYNDVSPRNPIITTSLRLLMEPKKDAAVWILEIKVDTTIL
jgi:hypothetical protein